MPVKSESSKFTVGDKVVIEMDGEEIKCVVSKFKGKNIVVEDEDGTNYECEPHEVTAAKGKKAAKAEPEEEEEEKPAKKKKAAKEDEPEDEEEKPAKGKKGGWNSIKPKTGGGGGMPIGKWEALAFNGVAEAKGKGISVYIEYVGVNDNDVNGKTQRQYFTIKDEKGVWTEGAEIMKGVLTTLGFKEAELELDEDDIIDELNGLLKKLRKREPWVAIRVKEGKDGYTNLYLQGLMDDQDDKPENPLADLPY